MQPDVCRHRRISGQIGLAAVLLMTVLLLLALSVSTQVASTVMEETNRLESTQVLNQAESQVDAAQGLGNQTAGNITTTAAVNTDNPSINQKKGAVVWLKKGDNIKIDFPSSGDNTLYWDYNDGSNSNKATACSSSRLMLTNIYNNGNNSKSYIITSLGCNSGNQKSADRTMCTAQGVSAGTCFFPFVNKIDLRGGGMSLESGEIIITALGDSTYVYMNNIATRVRAAAKNTNDNQIRVVEQTETAPAAPVVFNYSLFVGGGKITNQ
ncbi:hypothetical protein IJJ12_00100 [bacterium]|nr:hypothetical protein [bacterium]